MGTRLLLVDDHAVVRGGLRALLESRGDLEVVGEADDGWKAIELAAELSPDVVIMDAAMPRLNGAAAIRQIRKDCPGAVIVAFSMHSSDQHISQMLGAGASAYLLKTCDVEELLHAIRAALAGKTYLSPDIAGAVTEGYLASPSAALPDSKLSERERQVLQLLAEGEGSKQIARLLHVSPRTVDSHRHRMMEKLNIHTVAGLTKYAICMGLTPVEA